MIHTTTGFNTLELKVEVSERRVSNLQRFFSAFPGGWPGIALLILRAALGLALLVQSGFYFRASETTPVQWAVGLIAGVCGFLLLVGFLTPVVGGAVGAGALAISLSLLPSCVPSLFDSVVVLGFGATMLLAIVILGPGAFSVDARVFGRREIIIPPRVKSSA